MIEPKFSKGDYIINREGGVLAIVKGVSKKGYYQIKAYYSMFFDELKDVKNCNYDLQVNYDKFFDFCNDEEKNNLDGIIKRME